MPFQRFELVADPCMQFVRSHCFAQIHEPEQARFASQKCHSLAKLNQKVVQKVTINKPIGKYQDLSQKCLNYRQAQRKPICLMPSDKRACVQLVSQYQPNFQAYALKFSISSL